MTCFSLVSVSEGVATVLWLTGMFKGTGATKPMGKINLSKKNLILLGKYIVATIFFKMNFFYEYQGIKSSKIVP